MLLGSVPQLDRVAIQLGPFPVIGTGYYRYRCAIRSLAGNSRGRKARYSKRYIC